MLAADGVSCTTCHQITEEKPGTYESFVGRFAIDTLKPIVSVKFLGRIP
ncbi:hypothetical protein NC796_06570 [Aliifodinibius sp. S!AR15-10]|nr:hypothetical protein [Aliifodinibius sp. S!AR15-10]MDR8390792.1 hypothetical protein [Aliifodinibius sp. S!AR15-10]